MSQNLPMRSLRDFLLYFILTIPTYLRARTILNVIITYRFLFKPIDILSGILTVYFNCKFFSYSSAGFCLQGEISAGAKTDWIVISHALIAWPLKLGISNCYSLIHLQAPSNEWRQTRVSYEQNGFKRKYFTNKRRSCSQQHEEGNETARLKVYTGKASLALLYLADLFMNNLWTDQMVF